MVQLFGKSTGLVLQKKGDDVLIRNREIGFAVLIVTNALRYFSGMISLALKKKEKFILSYIDPNAEENKDTDDLAAELPNNTPRFIPKAILLI